MSIIQFMNLMSVHFYTLSYRSGKIHIYVGINPNMAEYIHCICHLMISGSRMLYFITSKCTKAISALCRFPSFLALLV